MGLPPLTYTVTASPLWAYNFTMLSSSFPGTNSETWSVPRVGKTAVTSARSFLLQRAHIPGMYAAWMDFNKYWGLKTYYKITRAKKKIGWWCPILTLPKHPILFLIQCLIYFHMFLGHVFPFYKERKKLRSGKQPKLACHWKLSPAFLTPHIALGPTPFSYMLGKAVNLWLNSSARAPRMTTREHWLQNPQGDTFICKTEQIQFLPHVPYPLSPHPPSVSPASGNH